jgi:hypothetical protein
LCQHSRLVALPYNVPSRDVKAVQPHIFQRSLPQVDATLRLC